MNLAGEWGAAIWTGISRFLNQRNNNQLLQKLLHDCVDFAAKTFFLICSQTNN